MPSSKTVKRRDVEDAVLFKAHGKIIDHLAKADKTDSWIPRDHVLFLILQGPQLRPMCLSCADHHLPEATSLCQLRKKLL